MEDVLAKLETDPGRLLREEQSANGSFQQLGKHQPSDEACRLAYSTEVIPRPYNGATSGRPHTGPQAD